MNSQEKEVYEFYKNQPIKYGEFHKSIFHLHTPASHDYYLYEKYKDTYNNLTDSDLYDIAVNEKLLINKEKLEFDKKIFTSDKEFISYLLIADKIIKGKIKTVVVSDHNTIDGYEKLKTAIAVYTTSKTTTCYPEVILGIEISCADLNHVVAMVDYKMKKDLENFVQEYIMDKEKGTYLSSIDVIKKIDEISGFSYIAHINSSNIFNGNSLSMAYKEKLFSLTSLNLIGISKIDEREKIQSMLKTITRKHFNFILDNDSHCIDTILDKVMWLKGTKSDFRIIKDLIRDYDITVSIDGPSKSNNYLESIVIENDKENFIVPKNNTEKYTIINFSPSLNCIIGGRGSGKSTILNIIQFILSFQIYTKENLEMICKHKKIWLIYKYNNVEYMIKLIPPKKEFFDDDIMKCFTKIPDGYTTYSFKPALDEDDIKKYTVRDYMKIYIVNESSNKNINITEYRESKITLLEKLFKKAYSINELVRISGNWELNYYIYDLIIKNSQIDKIQYRYKASNLKKLISNIELVGNLKQERTQKIESIIKEYNEKNKNKLKIVYFQNNYFEFNKLKLNTLSYKGFVKINNTIYNIREDNVYRYFVLLSSKLGLINTLKLMATCNTSELLKCIALRDFQEDFNQKSVEEGREQITKKNEEIILKSILYNIFCDSRSEEINYLIKNYLQDMEEFSLEFNVNSNKTGQSTIFRNVKQLSLGQKVVAMLTFILSYSDYSNDYTPLIIDQPEDNLDSQYIYNNLVEELKKIKEKRQVIIATHNSTIVTNSKTENVIIMKSNNEVGWIEKSGYPTEETILNNILIYLEGGKDSFNHKRKLYSDILDKNK